MTKSSETAFGPNTQEVLEWVNSQTIPFTNAKLHEAFPWLEPNNLNIIIFRLYRRGLIDRLARGLWGPKGVAQLKRPTQAHPVLTLTPGTQIHLVHEALREFEGPASVAQLSEATGMARDSISPLLSRLKAGNLATRIARGMWVFNS